jgi:hypothetical protein
MSFQSELRAQAAAVLEVEGDVVHHWEEHAKVVALVFPEATVNGFRVCLEANDTGLVVTAGRMHFHLDELEPPVHQVRDALGLVRDMLAPGMRLRERRFFGMPYRWYLESDREGAWVVEQEMGLLFWIPASFASTAIYQNHQLPPRRAV